MNADNRDVTKKLEQQDLESKLAIAVEALEFYERYWEKQFPDLPVIAREAIAKIRGEE